MSSEKKQLLYQVLKTISNSSVPVGSGFVRESLRLNGYDISEATVGRILREMDAEGYTEKVGFKGRILTSYGIEKLRELEHDHKIHHYGNELINVIKVTGRKNLIDILIARKVIESQLARFAAQYITRRELKEIEEVIKFQRIHVEKGLSIAEDDVRFHKLIAQAARNRVLDAALDLIRQHGQLSPVLEYIRKKVKSKVLLDHEKIFEAIASRNPEEAENAMVNHIENLIEDVEKYWNMVYESDDVNM
ncbi:GntR family transcriptional regulator, L-lactate dehydrogenase operon regulator [Caldanaerovirga acetigignens]|uniref:GntR family transcriptional regulator, L-lactate dehydrogenase operon regulator n=1 Tax=Caldanaerovirga acetigignens TaxID=447595 RepID=A0A1M7L8M4_9FIRM|nr:FCD domain-containing protein [Caldanaerovirga acetigignens]SHM74399.1 GntR family transcriptional regulator, L-lactate dehydrogenase operon regulator [Caldanaerovirga acetigignens]